ncbi:D-glucuronyl C5-epimerase family protein [Haloferax sp. KTX1]|uniref:D-glucuronyl C5-epimerase family protein n=1 Tax=Haloferax sp. KTX1 TaxID=2600597 RepID=UPI0011DDD1F3|nr:D-glucuronyl C5-epimerase family protein [Haloferax sp. KTX1]
MDAPTRRSFVAALVAGSSGCVGRGDPLGTEVSRAQRDGARFDVEATRRSFDLRRTSFEHRPQFILGRREAPRCLYDPGDVSGIEEVQTATIDGETGQMPIRTFRAMMRLTHCYRERGADPFLSKAMSIGEAALDNATRVEGVPYFPYTMPKGGSSAEMEPPWYSGMAQGTALSAYVRLYEHTGDVRHKWIADAVAESFGRIPRATDGPWTVMVDDGYYWIEEYPADPPTHVLNGFLVGLWGLYEYWLVFDEPDWVERLLNAAITTVYDHLSEYRVPGEVSWYGLDKEAGYRGNETYHAVHTHQIGVLYHLTGDDYFRTMERRFESDSAESNGYETPPSEWKHAGGERAD